MAPEVVQLLQAGHATAIATAAVGSRAEEVAQVPLLFLQGPQLLLTLPFLLQQHLCPSAQVPLKLQDGGVLVLLRGAEPSLSSVEGNAWPAFPTDLA